MRSKEKIPLRQGHRTPEAGERHTHTLTHTSWSSRGGNAKNVVVPAAERSGNAFLIEPFWEQAGWRRVRNGEELERKGLGAPTLPPFGSLETAKPGPLLSS